MTKEGILAASEIDQFPLYVRERMLLQVQRLADLYLLQLPPRQTELPLPPPPAERHPDVIELSERRIRARERAETKSS